MTLLRVNRVEVFDVFRAMSSDMDAHDKPFSFETVKGFMEKITELGMSSGANMLESGANTLESNIVYTVTFGCLILMLSLLGA